MYNKYKPGQLFILAKLSNYTYAYGKEMKVGELYKLLPDENSHGNNPILVRYKNPKQKFNNPEYIDWDQIIPIESKLGKLLYVEED